jgi:hypothetical protein
MLYKHNFVCGYYQQTSAVKVEFYKDIELPQFDLLQGP